MISLHKKIDNPFLNKTIEFLRQEMIRIGIQEGLTSEKTIRISQELDTYIAKYQMMSNN
ncbi:aspartyl-phosphate phosphatase Spo0E family protein [Bacillus sp. EB600]|uniref:aspartyl-phosphate phosphatase Spo0E family protein n=1 Tax=Bacillus sp. EB600 TaxID=2806345 RepID=UPI00210DFE09|nr:aspartyl-phosphate phosphatase Spo0E family protein [Bacillus sp. EB600]